MYVWLYYAPLLLHCILRIFKYLDSTLPGVFIPFSIIFNWQSIAEFRYLLTTSNNLFTFYCSIPDVNWYSTLSFWTFSLVIDPFKFLTSSKILSKLLLMFNQFTQRFIASFSCLLSNWSADINQEYLCQYSNYQLSVHYLLYIVSL